MKGILAQDANRLIEDHKPQRMGEKISDIEKLVQSNHGGVVFDGQRELSFPVKLVEKVIENKYEGDFLFTISEAIQNAQMHGNQLQKDKSTHFLWHICPRQSEFYVFDEGQKEFELEDIIEKRVRASFLRPTDESFLGKISAQATEFDFYAIRGNDGKKKGTVIRILKYDTQKNIPIIVSPENKLVIMRSGYVRQMKTEDASFLCDYIGHFMTGDLNENGNPFEPIFVNSKIAHGDQKCQTNGNIRIKVYDANQVAQSSNQSPYLEIASYPQYAQQIVTELTNGTFSRNVYNETATIKPHSIIQVSGQGEHTFVTKKMLDLIQTPKLIAKLRTSYSTSPTV